MVNDPLYQFFERSNSGSQTTTTFPQRFYPQTKTHHDLTIKDLKKYWLDAPRQFLLSLQAANGPFLSASADTANWQEIIGAGLADLEKAKESSDKIFVMTAAGLGSPRVRFPTAPPIWKLHIDHQAWGSVFQKLMDTASKVILLECKAEDRTDQHISIVVGWRLTSGKRWYHTSTRLTAWERCRIVLLAQNHLSRVSHLIMKFKSVF